MFLLSAFKLRFFKKLKCNLVGIFFGLLLVYHKNHLKQFFLLEFINELNLLDFFFVMQGSKLFHCSFSNCWSSELHLLRSVEGKSLIFSFDELSSEGGAIFKLWKISPEPGVILSFRQN